MIRRAWRWLLERGLEITFHSPTHSIDVQHNITSDDKPLKIVNVGQYPNIYAWFECELINHSEKKQRIIGAELHLKRKHWWFWWKTLASTNLNRVHGRNDDNQWSFDLAPMSGPHILGLRGQGPIGVPVKTLPKKMELFVEFKMVGPLRRIRRQYCQINHDPKILRESDMA